MNRLAIHFASELEQHLSYIAARCQPVCARTVIPLLAAFQFLLEAQFLDVELVGAEFLFFSVLLFAVAFSNERTDDRFQRFAVLG